MPKDSKLWDIIYDRPHITMKEVKEGNVEKLVPRIQK